MDDERERVGSGEKRYQSWEVILQPDVVSGWGICNFQASGKPPEEVKFVYEAFAGSTARKASGCRIQGKWNFWGTVETV